jgi:hypothetical protein
LRALERSRSVSLDEAHSLQRIRAQEFADQEAEHEACVQARESAYEAQRKQFGGAASFGVQELQGRRHYAASQLVQETAALAKREEAAKLLHESQDEVSCRLEELRVVERLRARRRTEYLRTRARRNQQRLDELALIKGWSARAVVTTVATDSTGEDICPSAE